MSSEKMFFKRQDPYNKKKTGNTIHNILIFLI